MFWLFKKKKKHCDNCKNCKNNYYKDLEKLLLSYRSDSNMNHRMNKELIQAKINKLERDIIELRFEYNNIEFPVQMIF